MTTPITFKAVIFDIDGTLTRNIAWVYLTEKIGGSIEYNDSVVAAWSKGEITEAEAKQRLVQNWSQAGRVLKSDWQEVLKQIPVREDAQETVDYLKTKGYQLGMITGSFDTYAELVGQQLGINDWYSATKIIWDADNKLTDLDTVIDDGAKKIDFLRA